MRIRRLAYSLVFLGAVLAGGTVMPLRNGGFEDGLAGWETDEHGMTLFLGDAARVGALGVRFKDDSPTKGADICSERIPAKAGAVYLVSCFVRTRGEAVKAALYLVCYDKDGKALTSVNAGNELKGAIEAGSSWHVCRLYARAVPGTETVAVRVHSAIQGVADMDVDDLELTELTAAESARAEIRELLEAKAAKRPVSELKLPLAYGRVASLMEAVEASVHPRLLASDARFSELAHEVMEHDGIRRRVFERMCAVADKLVAAPLLSGKLTGRRMSAPFTASRRVPILALCYRIAGKSAWRDRCIAELRNLASFKDWNPSHYLDTAEMTFAVAVGYDWLYDELSEADRELLAGAILEKGLKSGAANAWWRCRDSNWTQVCQAGLLAGALAIAERSPEICRRQVHESICNLAVPMSVYAPAGGYPEGVSYWSFGTSRNVIFLMLLAQAFGGDFGLGELPGFRETGLFNDCLMGPSGLSFSYADGGPVKRRSIWPLWWFAGRYGMPWLVDYTEREQLELQLADAEQLKLSADVIPCQPLLFFLVFDRETDAAPPPLPLVWSPQGAVPVAVLRNTHDAERMVFIALKGGSASHAHGHQDGGSFVLDSHKMRWFTDLGGEPYHRIESMGLNLWSMKQDSDRWKLFRLGNRGHNTLVIGGQPQVVTGHVRILEASDGAVKRVVLDMSAAYASVCSRALRTVTLTADGVTAMTDELEGLPPGVEVVWGANTFAAVTSSGGDEVTLEQGGRTLSVTNDSGIGAWRIVDANRPQPFFAGDSPNPGLTRVELVAVAPESGKLSLRVVIR